VNGEWSLAAVALAKVAMVNSQSLAHCNPWLSGYGKKMMEFSSRASFYFFLFHLFHLPTINPKPSLHNYGRGFDNTLLTIWGKPDSIQ
jgi:hypothetical protein